MPQQIDDLHVIVQFGKGIPPELQGPALMEFEKMLRGMCLLTRGVKLWVEVFKETKGDDSKLRTSMTAQERARL